MSPESSEGPVIKSTLNGLETPRGYRAQRNLWSGTWAIELEPGLRWSADAVLIAELVALLQACQREDSEPGGTQ